MKTTYLFLLLSVAVFGQETQKVTVKETREVYYVLKENRNVMHGPYQKLDWRNKPFIAGNYDHNKKVGEWSFYVNGGLEQTYDFSKNQVVYYKPVMEKDTAGKILVGIDTVLAKFSRPALYIGGSATFMGYIQRQINYPKEASRMGVQGKVIVSFWIDENGKTSDHRVVQGVGSGCDEEALRVVKGIPDAWLPAEIEGKKVKSEMQMPIKFQLAY